MIRERQTKAYLVVDHRAVHIIDAAGQTLGRVASAAVTYLRGKHRPTFTPNADAGDVVRVIHAGQTRFTGAKVRDKQYHWYSMYPGGLKSRSLAEQWERDPARVVRDAVYGMLPPNRLRSRIIKRLMVTP